MVMESTKKRNNYLKEKFGVSHIDDIPDPEEVIKDQLEEINFKDKKEKTKAGECQKCGSEEDLILILPKTKDRGYRHFQTFKDLHYKISQDMYGEEDPNPYQTNDFILDNWEDIIRKFEEELEAFKGRYSDLDNYITVCEGCNTIIYNYNLYLCQSCKESFHRPQYKKCFKCVKEEKGLKLCPICHKKYYNPDKNNKCKFCRD